MFAKKQIVESFCRRANILNTSDLEVFKINKRNYIRLYTKNKILSYKNKSKKYSIY